MYSRSRPTRVPPTHPAAVPLTLFVPMSTHAVQGSLPSELGLLTAVTAVHLASNALTGVVPSGRCTGARVRVRCAAIPHLLRCQNL